MTILAITRPTGLTKLYTVPAENKATLRIYFTNQFTTATTVSIWLVPSGGTPGVNTVCLFAYPLAGSDWDVSGEFFLDEGDQIWVDSDNGNVTFHVNGSTTFIKFRS